MWGSGDERAACGEDAYARGSCQFFLVRMGSLSTAYTGLPTRSSNRECVQCYVSRHISSLGSVRRQITPLIYQVDK